MAESSKHPPNPPSQTLVLVVEDEPAIAESVEYVLHRNDIKTQVVGELEKAWVAHARCDLILLDLMLPDGNGLELIERIRGGGSGVPIIVLSSRDSEEDRVRALEQGADDYVTKPFSPREIVARVHAVLRRVPRETERPNELSLRVDPEKRRAFCKGRTMELTRVEFDLLAELLSMPGRVYARAELIDRVWGDGFAITDRTIDSHVKSLRRKVQEAGGDPQLIETVRGVGYRVSEDA